jgi:16S rRNA (guanine527-N7)-methyltransferase
MRNQVIERAAAAGYTIAPNAAEQLAEYLELLTRWNRVHNLTAVRSVDELIRRHLLESLALQPFLRGKRIADVGSGAGLPGIPLAVAVPDKSFTLIESREKRVSFLRHVQGRLGLANLEIEHGRVEDLRDTPPFDTVLARAVAPLPELVSRTRHLLGTGSVLLVATKADFERDAAAVDPAFRVRRLEGEATENFRGALLEIERKEP